LVFKGKLEINELSNIVVFCEISNGYILLSGEFEGEHLFEDISNLTDYGGQDVIGCRIFCYCCCYELLAKLDGSFTQL